MNDHLIAEANRHAMTLPTTHPTHADIAWYVREVDQLSAEVESLHRIANAIEQAGKEQGARAARAEALAAKLLDALEGLARQNCHTEIVDRDYNGQVAGTFVTDSGACSTNAEALEVLAQHGRFRIVAGLGRMVVGYWPERDPAAPAAPAPPPGATQSALDPTARPSE